MRVTRNLRLSGRALAAHGVRTVLAVSSAAVGVAGVLVLTAIGTGARGEVLRRLDTLGRNVIVLTAATQEPRAGRGMQGSGRAQTLRAADAYAIRAGSAAIIRAAPAQDREMRARRAGIATSVTVVGTTPDWQVIRSFAVEHGRFFTDAENEVRARVAVIGSDVRRALFADSIDPIGREIRISRAPFTVIGILESRGTTVDGNATEDDRVYIPLNTALRRVFNIDYIGTIYLQAADAADVRQAEREAGDILRARHAGARAPDDAPRDDFVIQDARLALQAELAARASFARVIAAAGTLSLLIGGAGIFSMMLLSVRERRAEIGLRVAVGARRTDIMTQFIAEALLLAAAGGAVGIAVGAGCTALVAATTDWPAALSPVAVSAAAGAALAIGIGAGGVPAWRAATLDPVEALRAD